MPQTIASPATSELLVKKSRFLGFVQPVSDRAAALEAAHGQRVTLAFRVAGRAAPALVARLNEAASGQLEWLGDC